MQTERTRWRFHYGTVDELVWLRSNVPLFCPRVRSSQHATSRSLRSEYLQADAKSWAGSLAELCELELCELSTTSNKLTWRLAWCLSRLQRVGGSCAQCPKDRVSKRSQGRLVASKLVVFELPILGQSLPAPNVSELRTALIRPAPGRAAGTR